MAIVIFGFQSLMISFLTSITNNSTDSLISPDRLIFTSGLEKTFYSCHFFDGMGILQYQYEIKKKYCLLAEILNIFIIIVIIVTK